MVQRRHPRRRQLRSLALLLCLLALSRGASAQGPGIFELLTGANEGAPPVNGDTPATTTQPAAAEPAGDTPAATAQPEPTTTQPATDTPADQPAGNDGANDNNNNDNGNNNDTPATTTTAPTTTGGAATNDKNDAAPSFGTLNPGPATGGATTGGNAPSGFAGAAKPLNAGEVTAGTPPVDAKNGSDAAQVAPVGTVGTAVSPPPGDALPPAPPAAWAALQHDCQLVFNVEIRGRYIVPFTSPKGKVIARVLKDRYLRSALLPDISVGALGTFVYMSYDDPIASADPLPTTRRRLLARFLSSGGSAGAGRDLLQLEKSGAELKIVVATNQARVDSEIASFEEGVNSGQMARDFTLAGIDTENLTMLAVPFTEDLIGPGNVEGDDGGGFQGWVVAVVVGVMLLVLPVPLYLLVRWRKRKNKEAAAIQAAEAEAARQRMQSRMMRPGSKSFSLKPGAGSGSTADIMVRSGSIGGLAGFHNNGRLASWTGSPERTYGQERPGAGAAGQFSISRQASVTSMGSAMPSARSFGHARTPSLPGMPGRSPLPMSIPAGAYEEELEAAKTSRSERG